MVHKRTKLCLAVGATLFFNGALADETPPADTQENLERITVTGSRIVESFDEVPASITVIDQKTLQENLAVTSELQNLIALSVPGMAPSTGSSSNFG